MDEEYSEKGVSLRRISPILSLQAGCVVKQVLNPGLESRVKNIISKTRLFYEAESPGHFLVRTSFPVELPPVPDLRTVDMEKDKEMFLKAWLKMYKAVWESKKDVGDDEIPAIFPRYGIAEHSAWMGQEVIPQSDTNHPVELLGSLTETDKIDLTGNTPWFRYMKESYEILRWMQDGTFLLAPRGAMAPMELANVLRGNDMLMDFILNPDDSRKLISLLTEAGKWYYRHILEWSDEIEGGNTFAYGYGWAENCFGHLSNDTAMMCAPDVYNEFGLPYEIELTKGYDSVIYHAHSAGLHFLDQVAEIPNLKLLEISEDPTAPEPIETLETIYASTPGINHFMIHGTPDQFKENIHKLKQRNIFCDVLCRTENEAKEMVRFINRHSIL